jgi:hypothetical protein
MIIDLDSQTRIKGTAQCWQLEREHIVKGDAQWRPTGYFVTFAGAVREAYRREIRTHHAHGVQAALEAAEQALAKYRSVLDEFAVAEPK